MTTLFQTAVDGRYLLPTSCMATRADKQVDRTLNILEDVSLELGLNG